MACCLTCPRRTGDLPRIANSYGRFLVVPHGWHRWIVVEYGDDHLYRWVGPKPMWSQMQAERVAQALNIAKNNGYDLGRQDARAQAKAAQHSSAA